MKIASCGTMESNDCLMTVKENDALEIVIESIVFEQFGDQILRVIEETLEQLGIKNIYVLCQDKGALDYTIRARLATAVQRMGGEDA